MVNRNCVVVVRLNFNYRLKQWKKKDGSEHKDLSHGNCPCPGPSTLHRSPSKPLFSERTKTEFVKRENYLERIQLGPQVRVKWFVQSILLVDL